MTQVRIYEVAPGNVGIFETATLMRDHIRAYSPLVKSTEILLLQPLGNATDYEKAATIYTWVQRAMIYTRDRFRFRVNGRVVEGDEELHAPEEILRNIEANGYARGDCDDYVMLIAALLLAAGIESRLILTSAELPETHELDHVYLRVRTEYGWVGADAIHGAPFGWELPPDAVSELAEVPV